MNFGFKRARNSPVNSDLGSSKNHLKGMDRGLLGDAARRSHLREKPELPNLNVRQLRDLVFLL